MTSVCVFASAAGTLKPVYADLARTTGRLLAGRGHTVVYGGGCTSMMGQVAVGARSAGGTTIGVIPQFMADSGQSDGSATEMVITQTMQTRIEEMMVRSDAFLVLPGGLGTMSELFDVWLNKNMARHNKPLVVCDPMGDFRALRQALVGLADRGFIRREAFLHVDWADSPETAVRGLSMRLGPMP